MKKIIIAFFSILTYTSFAQGLPEGQVKNMEGKWVSTQSITNEGKPMIISFWATWCKPCLRELHAYMDYYIDWQDEIGVKLVAISIDDTRNSPKVPNMANSEGWEYEVYIDENQDLKRSLGIVNIPHTFVLDGEGNIVWQHAGYSPGDEDNLYEVLLKVAAGESVEDSH
jgi:cytochrome c biogenesis protein CcmG/thiol:disulfide interchange protein DsbE